jgi:hypothetical protein
MTKQQPVDFFKKYSQLIRESSECTDGQPCDTKTTEVDEGLADDFLSVAKKVQPNAKFAPKGGFKKPESNKPPVKRPPVDHGTGDVQKDFYNQPSDKPRYIGDSKINKSKVVAEQTGTLYEPENAVEFNKLTRGTKWTKMTESRFTSLLKKGPVYVWEGTDGKYAFNFGTGNIINEQSKRVSESIFKSHPALGSFVKMKGNPVRAGLTESTKKPAGKRKLTEWDDLSYDEALRRSDPELSKIGNRAYEPPHVPNVSPEQLEQFFKKNAHDIKFFTQSDELTDSLNNELQKLFSGDMELREIRKKGSRAVDDWILFHGGLFLYDTEKEHPEWLSESTRRKPVNLFLESYKRRGLMEGVSDRVLTKRKMIVSEARKLISLAESTKMPESIRRTYMSEAQKVIIQVKSGKLSEAQLNKLGEGIWGGVKELGKAAGRGIASGAKAVGKAVGDVAGKVGGKMKDAANAVGQTYQQGSNKQDAKTAIGSLDHISQLLAKTGTEVGDNMTVGQLKQALNGMVGD